MSATKKGFVYLTLLIVILSMAAQEVEGRRLVLRGRRTVTRHYYSGMLLPAWLVIVLVAIAEIVVGFVVYFVLKQLVLSKIHPTYKTYQPAQMEEAA